MKNDPYLRDYVRRGPNLDWLDLSTIEEFEVTFNAKMKIMAKNKNEVKKDLDTFIKSYRNALNEVKISNVKITQKKKK